MSVSVLKCYSYVWVKSVRRGCSNCINDHPKKKTQFNTYQVVSDFNKTSIPLNDVIKHLGSCITANHLFSHDLGRFQSEPLNNSFFFAAPEGKVSANTLMHASHNQSLLWLQNHSPYISAVVSYVKQQAFLVHTFSMLVVLFYHTVCCESS